MLRPNRGNRGYQDSITNTFSALNMARTCPSLAKLSKGLKVFPWHCNPFGLRSQRDGLHPLSRGEVLTLQTFGAREK